MENKINPAIDRFCRGLSSRVIRRVRNIVFKGQRGTSTSTGTIATSARFLSLGRCGHESVIR
jgi:hypothetical protein